MLFSRPLYRLLISISILLFTDVAVHSQVPDPVVAAQAPQPGSEHGYIGIGAETVNPADGQATFDLPIRTPADANNHLSGLSYDLSGNTQNDGTFTYVWDGESQLKSAGGVTYLYDGDGRRVTKVGSKLYWYGSGGEILSETSSTGVTINEFVYFGGKRVALQSNGGGGYAYVEDMLGSSRVMTQSGVVCYDADFYPYGGDAR